MVGISAFLGGRLLQAPPKIVLTAAAPAPRAEPASVLGPAGPTSVATPEPAMPPLAATPTPAARPEPAPETPAQAQVPSRPSDDVLVTALSLPSEMQPVAVKGQEEGVVVARALASSRGGLRAPEPTPSPAPTPTPAASPTPAPSPTPTKKETVKPLTYKVVAGDTIIGIAAKFGITPETVLWANDLGNGELLQIGQELTILPVSGVLHKVMKGETFNTIAEAYTAEPGRIIEANQLANADVLQEGQLLIVPGGMMRTVAVSGLPTAPSAQELAAAPKYTVKPGDTLVSIADAFGVRVSVIQVANGLLDPDRLQIGQVLSIPGGRQAAARPQPAPAAPRPAAAPAAPRPAAAPAAAPEPPPPAPNRSTGDRIAAIAQQYLGYRYVWGGTSPRTGFDCSGFTWYVYGQAGVRIPRAPLEGQIGAGPRIGRDNLLPGDLVFFQNTYKPGLSHVGIYLGGGRWINAEDESSGVQIRSLSDRFWAARYVGASRPW